MNHYILASDTDGLRPGEPARRVPRGFGHVVLCTREHLDEQIRAAFDERSRKRIEDPKSEGRYLMVKHHPAPEEASRLYGTSGGMKFEGCRIEEWKHAGAMPTAEVTFSMAGRGLFRIPLNEITEFWVIG